MKKILIFIIVLFVGLIFVFASGSSHKPVRVKSLDLSVKPGDIHRGDGLKCDIDFGKMPLYFVTNKGQVNGKAAFYAKASRYTLWLTKEGLVFDSFKREKETMERDVSRLVFVNADKNPVMVPVEGSKLRVNYFTGRGKSDWHCDVPTSGAVLYERLYKGIDLKVYGKEKQIEYDWIVKPGGNPGDICFEYTNVKGTRLDEEGNLLIETGFGELMHKKPVSFQFPGTATEMENPGERMDVDVKFKKIGKNRYGFEVGAYDVDRELIIDPVVLAYSTYLGGSGNEVGYAVTADVAGNVYVTGATYGSDFPTHNSYQGDLGGGDVFVTRLDTNESGVSSMVYSTYLGGANEDRGYGIAAGSGGNAYITGFTRSTDFPILNQYHGNKGNDDAFVVQLDTTQSGAASLIYSTYLGGGGHDYGDDIAVDAGGNVYVAGTTGSSDFPLLNQFQGDQGNYDAFVTRLDTTQSGAASLLFSTYLGGASTEYSDGIGVDAAGNAYVAGRTNSPDFPTVNQFQTRQGSDDTFVTRLDTNQSGAACLIYSTYLGGTGNDWGKDIAVDDNGNAYVGGITYSVDYPTLNQFMVEPGDSAADAFVTRLDSTQSGASSLIYSTYLGGGDHDTCWAIATDGNGNAYVTGQTNGTDFPVFNQYQDDQGLTDAYVTCLDTSQSGASSLVYSTYLGGDGLSQGHGIAVDGNRNVYVTGETYGSDNFPVLNEYQGNPGGSNGNVFVTKFSAFPPPPSITIVSPNGGENLEIGSVQNITWNAESISAKLKITLWKDGVRIGHIANNVDPAPGSYAWTVGEYTGGTASAGTGYTIKIKEKGTAVTDFSDAPFTLDAVITVTAPNGGENLETGTVQNITWNAGGLSSDVKITLWKDGVWVGIIADNIDPASGSYSWTMGDYIAGTALAGTGYKIKIKEKGTAVSDLSDAPFTITGI